MQNEHMRNGFNTTKALDLKTGCGFDPRAGQRNNY